MDAAELVALIGGLAGLATALGGLIIAFQKFRTQKAETDLKFAEIQQAARRSAMEEIETAIGGFAQINEDLRRHIADQQQRQEDQGHQLVDLNRRVTDVTALKTAAVLHIAERERWAQQRWTDRPETLPTIPAVLLSEVQQVDPNLRSSKYTLRDPKPKARDPTT